MNLVNMLMGITGKWAEVGDIVPVLVMRDQNKILPIYTPVIVSKAELYEYNALKKLGFLNDQRIGVMLYFSTLNGINARHKTKLNIDDLYELKSNGVTHNRKVKVVDYFDFEKLDNIVESLKIEGAITFVVEDLDASDEFINNLYIFKQKFANTIFYNYVNQSCRPGCDTDSLTTAITLYDLPYAIPVFNHNRVYGMGVNITMFWPEASKMSKELRSHSEISFVVNKYPDNLLYIDGAKVANPSFVGSEYLDFFSDTLRKEGLRHKKKSKLPKQEEKEAKKPHEKMMIEAPSALKEQTFDIRGTGWDNASTGDKWNISNTTWANVSTTSSTSGY